MTRPAIILSLLLIGGSSVRAQTVVRFPGHDWTVKTGRKQYGLVEYGPGYGMPRYTVIVWGYQQRKVELSIFVVAAVPVLLVGGIGLLAGRWFIHSPTLRKEAEPLSDKPT